MLNMFMTSFGESFSSFLKIIMNLVSHVWSRPIFKDENSTAVMTLTWRYKEL